MVVGSNPTRPTIKSTSYLVASIYQEKLIAGIAWTLRSQDFCHLYEKSMSWVFHLCSDWLFPGTRYKASQGVFAAYLNTSPSTVQKWEQGQKKPNGPSLKLLNLVDMHGLEALA